MAEKEERITIHQVLYPCKKCSINCNKNDWEDCDFYQNYISGMTRQEAIERMAKALYEHQYQKMRPLWEDEDNGYVEIYLKRAEAALNALLEGK